MIQQVNLAAEKNKKGGEAGSAAGVEQKQEGWGALFHKCDSGESGRHGVR